jgi:methyl-accepting chemotaxis protein
MATFLPDLSIKAKVITCAAIGFAMMLATALAIFWGDAAVNEAVGHGSKLRDELVAVLKGPSPGEAAARLEREIAEADRRAAGARATAGWTLVAVSAAGLGVFALLALWIILSVLKPVFAAMRVVHTVAGGDLTTHIEPRSRDETGQLLAALREMNDSLAGTVARVRRAAEAVAAATHSLGAGNADLSREAQQQAVSLAEAASATEQMSSSVALHADTSREASKLAESAALLAQGGGEIVDDVAGKMAAVQASSGRISDIVALIDSIAFQTNILALNAAVEAARAGEQGKGFAVVAAEVRSLAQRSATAARDIRGVVAESLGTIAAASSQAAEAGAKMLEIVEATGQVRDLMDRLASASREQSTGLSQVATVVGQLDNATQRYSHVVARLTAAAQSLERQAEDLVAAVSAFRVAEAWGPVEAGMPAPPPAAPGRAVPAAAPARALPRATRSPRGDGWKRF